MHKCVVCNRERPGLLPGRACQFCVDKDSHKACIGQHIEIACPEHGQIPGQCIQLDASVQTHELHHWHSVSLNVYYGQVSLQAILDQDTFEWPESYGRIAPQSLADALLMHKAAPWVPKWQPRALSMYSNKKLGFLLLIAIGQEYEPNITAVLRAGHCDPRVIQYYIDVLCQECGTIVSDNRFQNPKDTRFVLLSHGDWDLDMSIGSLQDLDDDSVVASLFSQRQQTVWADIRSANETGRLWSDINNGQICPASGDAIGVIVSSDTQCRTIIGALKLCNVTISHLDRHLQDNRQDAALLCRWFPEQLQRVFVLQKDPNCVRLLCHGRAMQARITWMTS